MLLKRLLIASLLGLAGLPSLGVLASPGPALTAFASVLPIQTFVERVGGDRVAARVMVQPGQSPATYDPTPAQVSALASAELYVRVGVPFEQAWMPRIRAANRDMAVLDLREGLPLRGIETHHHHDGDPHDAASSADADHDAMDPHIWTNPQLARKMLVAIRDTLSEIDPAGAATYAANQAEFDEELAALDAELQRIVAGLENRRFMVYHPAWGYFAEAYDLEQIPIEREGKSPGPRRLTALINQARATDTRVIFVQPQFDRRAAEQVARAIDGRVAAVDPLAADYVGSLRRFAKLLAGQTNAAP